MGSRWGSRDEASIRRLRRAYVRDQLRGCRARSSRRCLQRLARRDSSAVAARYEERHGRQQGAAGSWSSMGVSKIVHLVTMAGQAHHDIVYICA